MLNLDAVLAKAEADGQAALAYGMASDIPVVVTRVGLLRAGHEDVVSIPFDSIAWCESWLDTHRWGIRLVHQALDPRLPPSGADQWWRWLDRRTHKKMEERLSRETVLTFSTDHTAAARALQEELRVRDVACRMIPSPVRREPRAHAILQRVKRKLPVRPD